MDAAEEEEPHAMEEGGAEEDGAPSGVTKECTECQEEKVCPTPHHFAAPVYHTAVGLSCVASACCC